MISVKPTKNLTGITISGDYYDFNTFVESMHRMFTFDEFGDWPESSLDDSHKTTKTALLGFCYDIRKACEKCREVELVENGMDEDDMRFHRIQTPKENVYYSVNILFPQAIFFAAAAPKMFESSRRYYNGKVKDKNLFYSSFLKTDFYLDLKYIEFVSMLIWKALGEVIGEEELEKVLRLKDRAHENYSYYIINFIEKCDLELLKTSVPKRADKIKQIARKLVKKNAEYYRLEDEFFTLVVEHGVAITDVVDFGYEYPEEIEW